MRGLCTSVCFLLISFIGAAPLLADEIPRYASGSIDSLQWESFFTLPQCEHPGQRKDVWCKLEDMDRVRQEEGVAGRLNEIIRDENTRFIWLATFTLTDMATVNVLCEEANKRELEARIVIDAGQTTASPAIKKLASCSPNIKLLPRGAEFEEEGGYLQHAKIFLATSFSPSRPLSKMQPEEAMRLAKKDVTFASTTANLTPFGVSLHFENWLFFHAPAEHYLAQQNLCFFWAVENMQLGGSEAERKSFAQLYGQCSREIKMRKDPRLEFFVVPHGGESPVAYASLMDMVKSAKKSLHISMHRLTTRKIYETLAEKKAEGVDVKIIYDDDTLRTSKCNSGFFLALHGNDVFAYRYLREKGVPIYMMESNGEAKESAIVPQLFHNKYVIVDHNAVFVGAGNLTSASLNAHRIGNFEQFYIIRDPALVAHFVQSWGYFLQLATPDHEHFLFNHKDKKIRSGNGLMHIDDSVCSNQR